MYVYKISYTKMSIQNTQLSNPVASHLGGRPIIGEITETQVESRAKLPAVEVLGESDIEMMFVEQIPLGGLLRVMPSPSNQIVNHLLHCCRNWSDKI